MPRATRFKSLDRVLSFPWAIVCYRIESVMEEVELSVSLRLG